MKTIDVNADLGEGAANDYPLFRMVSSANIACGAHAGGGDLLTLSLIIANVFNVKIGAHPSYDDAPNFGRISRKDEMTTDSITRLVQWQVDRCAAARKGMQVSHVKAHGALYHDALYDMRVTEAYLDGVCSAANEYGVPWYPIMGMPNTPLHDLCTARGIPYIREGFCDRAYTTEGRLVPRSETGAVLSDPALVAAQAVRLATEGTVLLPNGDVLAMPVDTLCLHGDTPDAVEFAVNVIDALTVAGVAVAPFRVK